MCTRHYNNKFDDISNCKIVSKEETGRHHSKGIKEYDDRIVAVSGHDIYQDITNKVYIGEGLKGNQTLVPNNRAMIDAITSHKEIRLFKKLTTTSYIDYGSYYVSSFEYSDIGGRDGYKFNLIPKIPSFVF
jgi:hypothetical protein